MKKLNSKGTKTASNKGKTIQNVIGEDLAKFMPPVSRMGGSSSNGWDWANISSQSPGSLAAVGR